MREIPNRKLTLYKVINFLVNTVDFEGNHGSQKQLLLYNSGGISYYVLISRHLEVINTTSFRSVCLLNNL